MRLSRLLLAVAALVALPLVALSCGGARADCRRSALDILKAEAPDGYAIYQATGKPDFFESWIDCDAAQYDLSTAVHESTHLVTGETDAFPLVGGGAVARPHAVSALLPPSRIAGLFAPDSYTAIYLARGKATSATDFLYLLDELNAYSHDLAAAVDLQALRARDETVDHRDGLAAMMAFVAAYAETARASDPPTWRGLREPEAQATIQALWTRAERVMAASCGIPGFGVGDKAYIGRVCAAGPESAIASLIERAPACPAACLAPDAESASAADDTAPARFTPQDEPTADDRPAPRTPRHPFALRRHSRLRKDRPQQG